jgi:hypothetical protein
MTPLMNERQKIPFDLMTRLSPGFAENFLETEP